MKVDLRSAYDQVYDQGPDPSCGPHAVTAALDAMYEHATGKPHRFNKGQVWHWSRLWLGFAGQQVGSTFESLEKALRINGAVADGQPYDSTGPAHQLVRTELGNDGVAAVKRLLCMGVPVIWLMTVTDGFTKQTGPWQKHHWAWPAESRGEHFVAIVGFDDDCQRFTLENSWGPSAGDGGYFGLPYAYLTKPGLMQGIMHIDRAPVLPKPIEGYAMTVPVMLTADRAAFADRASKALMDHLTAKMLEGVPQLIAECKRWGVSDKHLEALAGWQRGSVRGFAQENPGLDWAGFVFDQL